MLHSKVKILCCDVLTQQVLTMGSYYIFAVDYHAY